VSVECVRVICLKNSPFLFFFSFFVVVNRVESSRAEQSTRRRERKKRRWERCDRKSPLGGLTKPQQLCVFFFSFSRLDSSVKSVEREREREKFELSLERLFPLVPWLSFEKKEEKEKKRQREKEREHMKVGREETSESTSPIWLDLTQSRNRLLKEAEAHGAVHCALSLFYSIRFNRMLHCRFEGVGHVRTVSRLHTTVFERVLALEGCNNNLFFESSLHFVSISIFWSTDRQRERERERAMSRDRWGQMRWGRKGKRRNRRRRKGPSNKKRRRKNEKKRKMIFSLASVSCCPSLSLSLLCVYVSHF